MVSYAKQFSNQRCEQTLLHLPPATTQTPSRHLFLAEQAADHAHRAGTTLLLLVLVAAASEHIAQAAKSKATKQLVDTKAT